MVKKTAKNAKRPKGARRPTGIDDDAGFESIGIADDLMFKQVFGDDIALARRMLELATGEEVGEVDYVRSSEELRPEWDARATTFDVYLKTGEGDVGDLEMQSSQKGEIPLRLRTHLANLDREAIRRGDGFGEARESVVVFVCTFDPLSAGLRRYTVRRYVEETGDAFPDRQRGILLNANGKKGEVPGDLELFLRYVSGYHGEEVLASDFVRDVDAAVRRTRADWKWRRVWMNMQEKLYDARQEGREEGLKEGREEGREEGTLKTLAKLVAKGLLSIEDAAANLGVTEDAIREEMERVRA